MLIANKRLYCIDYIVNRDYKIENLISEWNLKRKKKSCDV